MSKKMSLEELAERAGLATGYTEIGGVHREVPPESLRALLEGLGYGADGGEKFEAADAEAPLEPVVASFEPAPVRVELNSHGLLGETLEWALAGEGEEAAGAVALEGLEARGDKRLLALPPLAPGYYSLTVKSGNKTAETLLVRAPAKAWLPEEPTRGYGFSIQLYEQIGPSSIGIGDFGDLAGLGEAAGRMGAVTLALNPLHALFLAAPERASPYSPSSRLALNALYLDLRRLPGFDEAMRERLARPAFAAHAAALKAQRLIDYPATARTKLSIAREAFSNFAAAADTAFAAFQKQAAPGILRWAQFETLAAEFGADLHAWPSALRDCSEHELDRFLAAQREAYDFHLWLQWQADVQLGSAARRARDAGLGLGLFHDLALGADPGGAEVWAGREDFAITLAVGAPPDPLNPRGQNWGFPPLHPRGLLERRLGPFIELIRANMRHAGVLRIDHVLGLNRLFVIPSGAAPAQGAYLRYPFDPLLAVIVLESHRAHCIVVGEDLGTVPEGLRERLAERGIFSLRLLYFERGETGRPRPRESYPREALTAVGSHDLVPLAGWWRGEDLERSDRLGFWPAEEVRAAARDARLADRAALAEDLLRADLPGAEAEPPTAAVYRWLAGTPSLLVAIQPEDALELNEPVNVPGTTEEEPNWRRRRLPPWPEWLADPRFVEVLRAVQAERGGPSRRVPSAFTATYRVQLHADFGFAKAAELLPYLESLGVSHLYLSPVMSAVPGSLHGYDVSDPARLDESRGGAAGFGGLLAASEDRGLGLVVDFVPNHMAAHKANPWWMDLLEWGHASRYAASFDVDWSGEEDRLVVPVLGASPEAVLARGEIRLVFEPSGRFCAEYFSRRLPLAPATVAGMIRLAARRLDSADERGNLAGLARRLRRLSVEPAGERRAAGLLLQAELAALAEDGRAASALEAAAAAFTGDAERLARLLECQPWRLVHWRRGMEDINYRRFFDIADLAALRMERPAVFAAVHAGIRGLLAAPGVQGLRLDHVDGLAAPGRYLDTLHDLIEVHGGGVRLWVEKILAADEALCPWPVAGTTGYEFLNDVTRFFMMATGAARLREIWREFVPEARPFAETLAAAKHETLEELFAPMLDRVVNAFAQRALVAPSRLRSALAEIAVALPVYRAYPDAPAGARPAQEALVARAAAAVSDAEAREWLARLLALPVDEAARLPGPLRDGVARFWQLSSAVTAKGLEDTAFYRDFALLALNEVGGDPRLDSLEAGDFHARMQRRARDWPAALSASATHDTKRGEDARMRLAMLSAHAQEWAALLPQLRDCAARIRPASLHPADEYLVWQTLLAVWPPPAEPLGAAGRKELAARLETYLRKALREGKKRSSWFAPDEDYERLVVSYAAALLDPRLSADFQHEFLPCAAAVARSGALASLAALALKCTAPGVSDVYQGTELWDLSLVDPDNRRPVDYAGRIALVEALAKTLKRQARGEDIERFLAEWPDGRIKMYLLGVLLDLRRSRAGVFSEGAYRPLDASGEQAGNLIAFRRAAGADSVTIVAARPIPKLQAQDRCALQALAWGDTALESGEDSVRRWRDVLSGRRYEAGELQVGKLLSPLPVAILVAD